MKITYCGPISINIVADIFSASLDGLKGYQYPLGAYLCKKYHEMGHDIQIVSCTSEIDSPRSFKGNGLAVNLIPRRRASRFLLDAYRAERQGMTDAIKKYSPDIIHAQWCYEFAHAARDSSFPTLVTIRDVPLQILKQLRTIYRLYRLLYARFVISKCSNFSCISPYVKEELLGWFPQNARISLIANGLDGAYFRENTSIPNVATNLLCITGSDRRKNFPLVFESCLRSMQKNPLLTLTVCGSGLDKNCEWAKRAEKSGRGKNFIWLGSCTHKELLEKIIPSADIFITATKEESFCMVVLEAMAGRVPVIALRGVGAIPWLLNNAQCGMLIDNTNPSEWANAILALSENQAERTRISKAAYLRAHEFRIDKIAARYVEEFKAITKT